GLLDWTVGVLPRAVNASWAGHNVTVYRALADRGDSVAVRLLASGAEQTIPMKAGTRRLLLLTLPSATKSVQRVVPDATKLVLRRGELEQCIAAGIDRSSAEQR